jgi:hypothetical protein
MGECAFKDAERVEKQRTGLFRTRSSLHAVMKKRIAVLGVALLVLALMPRVHAAESSRDLWVAVLQNELLVPIGALVDGKWWYTPSDDNDPDRRLALLETLGKLPVQWLPAGRPLPTTWQAHLLTGETRPVHLNGPLEEDQDSNEIGVRTDLVLPPRDPSEVFVTHGVGVAGAVSVRLFSGIGEEKRPRDVLRFLDAPASKAERAAIKAHGGSAVENAQAWAALSDQKIAAGSFEVEEMRSIAQRDGSTMYYIEQSKAPLPDCEVHVRATVVKSSSGSLRLTAIQAEPRCDNYVNLKPIAIMERGGAACWITEQALEDGVIFTLTRPGIRYAFAQSSCAMK